MHIFNGYTYGDKQLVCEFGRNLSVFFSGFYSNAEPPPSIFFSSFDHFIPRFRAFLPPTLWWPLSS